MDIDEKTLESLRQLGPREAYDSIRQAVYRIPGGASSEDLLSAMEQMVDAGILTWAQIESFEES
jgi:hypothetical protein